MEEMFQQPAPHVPDATIALGVRVTAQALQQQVTQLTPMWQMATQIVAKKTPQQPLDPAVQKTFEAAMAEIQRKSQVDQREGQLAMAEFSLKQAEAQFNQQQVVQTLQQEASKQQAEFQRDIQMFMQSMQQENAKLQATIKNNSDKFLIELMKMEQANEKLRAEAEQKQQALEAKLAEDMLNRQNAFEPHLKQMGEMISQIKETKSNDSLDALLQGMHSVMQHLAAPTDLTLIKGPDGKTIGARKTTIINQTAE